MVSYLELMLSLLKSYAVIFDHLFFVISSGTIRFLSTYLFIQLCRGESWPPSQKAEYGLLGSVLIFDFHNVFSVE